MDGFQKISLGQNDFAKQKSAPVRKPMSRRKSRKRLLTYVYAGTLVLVLFLVFLVILPARAAYTQAKQTIAQAKIAAADLKQQNIAAASDDLKKTQDALLLTKKDIDGMWYVRFIPIANFYYNDAYHLINAGTYGINAGQIAIDAVKPYADLLGLKGQKFAGGTTQDRIQTAVLTMGKITPRIDDVEKQLVAVKGEIDQVDPNHYPSLFGGDKVKKQLIDIRTYTDETVSFIEQAKPLVKVLPTTLGEPTEQRYLVIFQNDKERRPTGGFLTAYSIFRVDKGLIHVDTSNDIYTLDDTIANKPSAPRPILQYLPKVYQLNLRDTNLSPDFVTSMNAFNDLYKRAGGYQKVDGIIAVDTQALVAAMNILGDMQAGGETFTTKEDPRCHCPEVIYALESTADRPLGYIKTDRKSVIGELMYAIMNKAFTSSAKQYWGALFQAMITQTTQKHILFDVYNNDAQSGLESLNASGRITQNVQGDYFHLNEANFGGAKSNMYVSESVDQKYDVGNDGTLTKTVAVHYKNPFPPSDCNLEHGNLCLNAPLRNWVRVYVPKGSQLVSSKGSEVKMTSYEELGKTVFEGFLIIRPLGTATFTLTYKLPFKLADNSPLPLLIQKQPGVDTQDTTISSGDRQLESFSLVSDTTLKLNLR